MSNAFTHRLRDHAPCESFLFPRVEEHLREIPRKAERNCPISQDDAGVSIGTGRELEHACLRTCTTQVQLQVRSRRTNMFPKKLQPFPNPELIACLSLALEWSA